MAIAVNISKLQKPFNLHKLKRGQTRYYFLLKSLNVAISISIKPTALKNLH